MDGVNIHKRSNIRDYFTYNVGFLFQNFALVEDKTVKQNLNYVQPKAHSGLEMDDILDELGI